MTLCEPCGCRVKERTRDLTCPSHRVHRSFTGLTEDVRNLEVGEALMLDVLVVTSPACHLCEDALEVLEGLAREYPLSIRQTSIDSDEGRAVFERFHPPLPPFVVVDDELFSAGRLPRKKLHGYLERSKSVA